MASLTEAVQAALRAVTGSSGAYNEDWHAYADLNGIATGQWGERVLALAQLQDATISTVSAAHNAFLYENIALGVSSPYFILDTVSGTYKSNGVAYATEADMNTALGITKTGEARVVPTYVNPASPEMVTNGAFTAGDISGWTAGQVGGSGASIAAGTGGHADQLIVNTGGATQAFARQTIPLPMGKAFRLQADVGRDTSTGQPSLGGSYNTTFQNPEGFLQFTPTVGGAAVTASVVTGATQTTLVPSPRNIEPTNYTGNLSFRLGSNANTESAGIYFFDNVSIKEAVPLPGAVWNKLGCIITFTTPASFTKVETVIQFGVDGTAGSTNSEKDRMRLSIDASGNLTWAVLVQNISAASRALGTLSPSTQYTVWMHNGPDSFGVRIGAGGTIYRFPAALLGGGEIGGSKAVLNFIPALGKVWIGRSFVSSDAFTGVVNKVVLRSDKVFPDSRPVISLGDSLAFIGSSGINSSAALGNAAYYGANGYWPQMLSRGTARPSRCAVFSWGGAYGSGIRAAFGDGLTHAQMTPIISAGNGQFPAIVDAFAPYANLDPIFVINNTYNLMNGSSNLTNANLNATASINNTIGQIADIKAVYPAFDKFLAIGCRYGPGGTVGTPDPEFLPGGYKRAGMDKINIDYPAAAAANNFHFANLQAFLINNSGDPTLSGLAAAGLTASAQDLTDIGNGFIPDSLRNAGDPIHQGSYGQLAEAAFYQDQITSLGWDTFSTVGTIYAEAA